MRLNLIRKYVSAALALMVMGAANGLPAYAQEPTAVGGTSIATWQFGKRAAISLTYDDSTINQFRVALPIMKSLGLPATFFVITGAIPGSQYHAKFVGPPVSDIVASTKSVPTNAKNFYQRASALRFVGYKGVNKYFMDAGDEYAKGDVEAAYHLIDKAYALVRSGTATREPVSEQVRDYVLRFGQSTYSESGANRFAEVTWEQLKKYQSEGFEIGSHTISHPYMSILDDANIAYELTASKQELMEKLGKSAAFSAEIPFGISNKRAVGFGLRTYQALRNWMPEPYLTEINRGDRQNPLDATTDYVQWQRGPLTKTPMSLMKSWVDTAVRSDNIWLVLVFHGIEGVGWEPLSGAEIKEYFSFIKENDQNAWVATFQDVAKYMRERESSSVRSKLDGSSVVVKLSGTLDRSTYDLPLTLKTRVPSSWGAVKVLQGKKAVTVQAHADGQDKYAVYQAVPDGTTILLSRAVQ